MESYSAPVWNTCANYIINNAWLFHSVYVGRFIKFGYQVIVVSDYSVIISAEFVITDIIIYGIIIACG